MKAGLFRLLLYALIALIPISCGVRKVESDIAKSNNEQIANTKKQILESASEKYKQQSESVKANDKTNETTETTTTTEYDKDTGKPTKSTTTTKTGKYVDKSVKNKKTYKESEKLRTLTIRERETVTIKNSTFENHKKTATNRNGLYYMLGAIGLFAVFLIYLRFKR